MRRCETEMTDDIKRSLASELNHYKELATAVALVLGGFIWILGYFATKSELDSLHKATTAESDKINCLLRLNVEWLAGEQLWKISYDEVARIDAELRSFAPSPGSVPNPATLPQIVALERKKAELNSELETARIQKNEARGRLMRGECGRDG